MSPEDKEEAEDISSLLKRTAEEVKKEKTAAEEEPADEVSDIFTDFDFSEVSSEGDDFLEGVIPFDEALLVKKKKEVLPTWFILSIIGVISLILLVLIYFIAVKPFLYNYYFGNAIAKLENNKPHEEYLNKSLHYSKNKLETYIDFGHACLDNNRLKLGIKYLHIAKYGDKDMPRLSSLEDIDRITDLTKNEKVKIINLESRIEIMKRNYLDAKKLCQRVKKLVGDVDETFFNLGTIEFKKDNYEKAVEYFKKVISLNPHYISAYIQLRRLYLKLDLPNKAYYIQRSLDNLDNAPPRNDEAYAALGQIFLANGNLELAKEQFEKSLSLNYQQSLPYLKLAEIYIARKQADKTPDYKQAIKYYKKYLSINTTDAKIKAEVGLLYYKLGDIKNSVLYLQKAINGNPSLPRVYYYIGTIQLDYFNNYQAAINSFLKSIELGYKSPRLSFNLAKAYYLNSDYKKAIPIFSEIYSNKILPENIEFEDIRYNLSNSYLMDNNFSNSIKYYNEILSDSALLKPDFLVRVHNNLSIAYYKLSNKLNDANYTKSLESLWTAIELQEEINKKEDFIKGKNLPVVNLKEVLAAKNFDDLKENIYWSLRP